MANYDYLPEPREVDLGNGIIRLDNAYSIFVRGAYLGTEYVDAHRWVDNAGDIHPFSTGHVMYVCKQCGDVWARKVLRAFPLWEAQDWIIEAVPCDGAILVHEDIDAEALRQQPALLLQACDAYLRIAGATKGDCSA